LAKSDYYAVLGVSRQADEREIKRAYHVEALRWHPDRNPGDPTAEERFRAAAEAYEILRDPQQRRLYDLSPAHFQPGRNLAGFGRGGGRRRGRGRGCGGRCARRYGSWE